MGQVAGKTERKIIKHRYGKTDHHLSRKCFTAVGLVIRRQFSLADTLKMLR